MRGCKKIFLVSIFFYGKGGSIIYGYAYDVSKLIGPVAFTLLERGIDAYNSKFSKNVEINKETLINSDEEKNILLFLADYYSQYMGPVAKRLASLKIEERRFRKNN